MEKQTPSQAASLRVARPQASADPRKQSKGGETERNVAMRGAAFTSGSENGSKKKRDESKRPHLAPLTTAGTAREPRQQAVVNAARHQITAAALAAPPVGAARSP